ncbi:MAG: alpha-L-rhamnosidase [Bacteroidales bacterium]|nr:alpha-L-rhamnosidase [Bacteroidales bacterium]MCF8389590.1 alpha-L-rhamnosidase [Bacteroidales bacterium]
MKNALFRIWFQIIGAGFKTLKKLKGPSLVIILILVLSFTNCSKGLFNKIPSPTGLLCELLREPEKAVITDSIPEFSWIFPKEGINQKSYHILLASSKRWLKKGKVDYWDSDVVWSAKSINVPYSGKTLKSETTYYWKVRVTGENNTISKYSKEQQFNTGLFSGRNPDWPGQSRYIEMKNGQWVSENRQTATFKMLEPLQFEKLEEGHFFADFGKAAFGTLEIDVNITDDSAVLEIYLGERRNPDLTVNKEPGVSNIGFQKVDVGFQKGTHTFRVALPPHDNRYPHSQKLAPFFPEVMPFRYVEIRSKAGGFKIHNLRQLALYYPFDDGASFFKSDNQNLNRVWELCKYTLKATPFLGVYADGNRERMPYEADAYIQQLGHYTVDREFSIARYTADFLIYHASWPTEWQMHTVFMAWEDFMNTGNSEFIERAYEDLKSKTLISIAREDGLISSRTDKVNPGFLKSIYYNGDKFKDNIDWPKGTPAGEKQARNAGPTPEGERDGYVFADYNTVINAFHYRSLLLMGKMAEALNKSEDKDFFYKRAEQVKKSFMTAFFDKDRGIFTDGENTDHASLHANMFPLAFGLVPKEQMDTILEFIKSRGMACSVYGAQYLLEALYMAGAADYALNLMTSEGKRSWMNMIKVGSTMTTEAWDEYYKPNLTWNHAWGSAPANIIIRKVMGIEALEPGFEKFRVCPQPGYLDTLIIRKPCIRGTIEAKLIQKQYSWNLEVTVPGNTQAEIWIPDRFSSVIINGEKEVRKNTKHFASGTRNVFILESGTFTIIAEEVKSNK